MFSDLDISLNKIKNLNEKEYQKKLKKYNLKDNRCKEDSDSYLIKKYIRERQKNEYKNSIRLKSLRLEDTNKYFKGDENDFIKKYNEQNNSIFKKKWSSLPYNVKKIQLYSFFKKNKTDDNIKNIILQLLYDKKLKKQVQYNIDDGFIENIKLENDT